MEDLFKAGVKEGRKEAAEMVRRWPTIYLDDVARVILKEIADAIEGE